jgi:hypothetical protein
MLFLTKFPFYDIVVCGKPYDCRPDAAQVK